MLIKMALTLNSYPADIDNSAIFDYSTDLVDNGTTIVNPRVETTLYKDGVAIAKKVKPKGINLHDYTSILRSLTKFSNPSPFDETAGAVIKEPGAGANLITSWTNDGTSPFDVFSVTGNVFTNVQNTGGAGIAISNSITLDSSKIYVCLLKGGTMSVVGSAASMNMQFHNGSSYLGSMVSIDNANSMRRFYIQPRFTGTGTFRFACSNPNTCSFSGVTIELYALNANDWYAGYYVKAEEKYENAGTTTTGASSTSYMLKLFIDCPGVPSATFTANYYAVSASRLPLCNLAYDCNTSVIKAPEATYDLTGIINLTPPTGQASRFWYAVVPGRFSAQIRTKTNLYLYDYSLVSGPNLGTLQNCLHPIQVVGVDKSCCVYMTGYTDLFDITLQDENGTVLHKYVTIGAERRSFPDNVCIMWRNDKGGWSQKNFPNEIKKTRKSINRQFVKGSTSMKLMHYDEAIETVQAKGFTNGSKNKAGFLRDLLHTKQCVWYRGPADLVNVSPIIDTLLYNDYNLITPVVEFEYAP
jgi:hypothetical protein